MSREALKANRPMWKLVRAWERNRDSLVKIVSAMDWVSTQDGGAADLSPFNRALFDVIQERRNLRVALEEKLKQVKEQACS